MLGVMYQIGMGVRRDPEKAARWYLKAADQGYADAQVALGAMYQKGKGVSQDNVAAAEWYRRAAEQGVAEAQWLLAQMYVQGEGVPQDNVRAYAWMSLSLARRAELDRGIFDSLAGRMTPTQIAAARRLAEQWRHTYAAK